MESYAQAQATVGNDQRTCVELNTLEKPGI